MQRSFPHLIVLYALLALITVAVIYFQLTGDGTVGEWQCSNIVCSQTTGPEPWIAENCFDMAVSDTENAVMCRVVIDQQNRLVPLNELNLTDLRVCTQYACVQEVNVRTTNYTINVTQ